MHKKRDVVIFDFGGVLIDWNPRYLYRKLFGDDEQAMETFLAEVTTPEWNLRQDAGRSWDEAVRLLTDEHPTKAELIAAYQHRWEETLGGAIDDSLHILRELKEAGHPLYGLTNWSHETFPFARERFDFLGLFDGIVVSGEEGMIKPDPRLYQTLLERYDIDPATAVFIDDNKANVDAADALGIHGIHFHTPRQLRDELIALGFLSA
ncbi:MAG: HAD family phosphatase [Luteibacter sp.]|mgnify:CR=1 FL=1|jgi:2-haloacid dehalogenase|uniref:HAD family hydrolase n=1 Tax=Luteibacter TaxID=242605 RepID=UPI0005649C0A|nr:MULTISPECIES: HAD family phosphatase [unclassified Luteibacter]MDQ7997945.1 HAD family phosphatase [Luteibacter sp.]MDQ8050097.1 HAD family phosphatase [Luteibacter sp.]MDR6641437.1 2-haloacid dehalogenase [Luteibacter sp. 1214]